MTYEEAIAYFKGCLVNLEHLGFGDCKQAVAYKIATSAIEQQIQKKPLEDRKYYGIGKCPVCGVVFIRKDLITPYCGNCGQALDWSE